MPNYALKVLTTIICSLSIMISVSACSSTLAPEDDETTEYVFQSSDDQVLAKDDKGRSDDDSDD